MPDRRLSFSARWECGWSGPRSRLGSTLYTRSAACLDSSGACRLCRQMLLEPFCRQQGLRGKSVALRTILPPTLPANTLIIGTDFKLVLPGVKQKGRRPGQRDSNKVST